MVFINVHLDFVLDYRYLYWLLRYFTSIFRKLKLKFEFCLPVFCSFFIFISMFKWVLVYENIFNFLSISGFGFDIVFNYKYRYQLFRMISILLSILISVANNYKFPSVAIKRFKLVFLNFITYKP